ncbi:hypothetical protein ACHAWF_012540 [Thalassiosira exigua]
MFEIAPWDLFAKNSQRREAMETRFCLPPSRSMSAPFCGALCLPTYPPVYPPSHFTNGADTTNLHRPPPADPLLLSPALPRAVVDFAPLPLPSPAAVLLLLLLLGIAGIVLPCDVPAGRALRAVFGVGDAVVLLGSFCIDVWSDFDRDERERADSGRTDARGGARRCDGERGRMACMAFHRETGSAGRDERSNDNRPPGRPPRSTTNACAHRNSLGFGHDGGYALRLSSVRFSFGSIASFVFYCLVVAVVL